MKKNKVKQWFVNILISIDQLGNTLAGGDPDETISSRIGKLKQRHGGVIPWSKHPFVRILDKFLDTIDENHSIDAIENDEGGKQVWKE